MFSYHIVFLIALGFGLNIQSCAGQNETNTTVAISTASNVTVSSLNSTNTTTPHSASTTTIIVATTTAYIEASSATDYYSSVDSRLVNIINTWYSGLSNTQVAYYAANVTLYGPIYIDNITAVMWETQCNAALDYLSYMADMVVVYDQASYVTTTRINKLLGCASDCDFSYLLSVPSSFNSQGSYCGDGTYNDTAFAADVMLYLPSDVASTCIFTFCSLASSASAWLEPSASDLLGNLNYLSLADPSALDSFSESDSIALAASIASSGKELTDAQIEALAGNLPDTYSVPLDNLTALANAIPLTVFDSTPPADLVALIANGKLSLSTMDDSRKVYIANTIVNSQDPVIIRNLLLATSDSTVLNAIPASLFSDLSVNITGVASSRIPPSYLQSLADSTLASSCISSITSLSTISTLLPGITADSLTCITDSLKIATVVNIVNSALTYGYTSTSVQRGAILSSLLNSLSTLANSTNATVYLAQLSAANCQILYPLFIEANSTVLSGFSKLNTFATLIKQVANIDSSSCCVFSPSAWSVFTQYALTKLFGYTKLVSSDLDTIGKCMQANLPISYLQNLSPSVFITKYSLLGVIFQPNVDKQAVVTSLITSYASNTTLTPSQNKLLFTTLNDLALFYPFTNSTFSANLTGWANSGGSTLNQLLLRDPTNSNNDLCQLGLNSTDQAALTSLITSFSTSLATQLFGTSSRRKRATTVTANYTCSKLKQMGKGVIALSTSQLAQIKQSEFVSCITSLGTITKWSTSQLSTLATLALKNYGSTSNLTTQQITALNSIMQGFSATQLISLNFTSTTSINALGALNLWTADQLNALTTPLTKYITTYLNNNISSTFITAAGNLLCSLTTAQISSASNSSLKLAVGSPSKISIACPTVSTWYKIYRPLFKNSGVSKRSTTTTAVLTKSSVSSLGTVIAGITVSDLSTLPASTISSISASAFSIMPADTVNSLTTAQLNGLSMSQLSALTNSPYYSSFSTSIKSGLTSLTANAAATAKTSSGLKLNFNMISLISCLIFFILF